MNIVMSAYANIVSTHIHVCIYCNICLTPPSIRLWFPDGHFGQSWFSVGHHCGTTHHWQQEECTEAAAIQICVLLHDSTGDICTIV